MRVLSWNVTGRVKEALRSQLRKLLERSPDIVALQEVTGESYGAWCEGLTAKGYSVVSSVELLALPYPDPTIERRYMNLIAARHPLALLSGLSFDEPDQARMAFPEKYVVARVCVDGAAVDVHNAHLVPGSSRGVVKVHMFEAIGRRIEQPTACARILCGDFNTPRWEDDSSLTTWARRRGSAWDRAERSVLEHPELRDAYRALRKRGDALPVSHFTGVTPRRYDHIYVSPELHPTACEYLSSWLHSGLSDHAAVEAELMLAARRTQSSSGAS
jgi:endonuclease/exonuclease/phosphatase family metal-dependent hydrolase